MNKPKEVGYYWVWYENAWEQGYWDGEDWNVKGSSFSFRIPHTEKWNIPEKPSLESTLP